MAVQEKKNNVQPDVIDCAEVKIHICWGVLAARLVIKKRNAEEFLEKMAKMKFRFESGPADETSNHGQS